MIKPQPPLDPGARIGLLERLEKFTSDDDEVTPSELAARFLPRREFKAAMDPRIVILRGDRGAGKTSLFKVATSGQTAVLVNSEQWWEGFADASGHPAGDTLESIAVDVDDRMLRTFWLTHLVGRLLHHDPTLPGWVPDSYSQAPANPKAWLSEADADLGRVQSSLDACDGEFTRRGRTVTIAYDHLDRIGVTQPEVRVRASSALMAIWLSLSSRYRAIRGKLFLRNDLFEAGLSRSADASKLETRSIDLAWTTQDLYRALLRRMGADSELRDWLESVLEPGALSEVQGAGWMPISPLPVEGAVSQKAIADALAGEIMGAGVKKGYTHRWIPNHLQDGNARIVPRSLFNLMRFAAQEALGGTPRASGRQLLHHTELHAALIETSKRRVNELAEEYPVIKRVEGLRDGTAPFKRSDVMKRLDAGTGAGGVSGEPLIEELIGIGVLTGRKDGRIDLPDIYRYGLGVKRRGGVSRPR